MRRSRRIRSNRYHSRRMRRNSRSASRARGAQRQEIVLTPVLIGESFLNKRRTPFMGRVKRVFDLPSDLTYYGSRAYSKKFGTIPPAWADAYARDYFGVAVPKRRTSRRRAAAAEAPLAANRRRSRRLYPNTLIRAVADKAIEVAPKGVVPMYQLVETTEGGRMWRKSYPITVAGYMTTGYLRDFKLGGIALRKAQMAPGTRISGGEKRKKARRNIPKIILKAK